MKNKFAVVIPLYNKADTIIRALDSVAAQSFTNYEVVVVDDGSIDGSGKLADSYRGIKNYKVIHQKNAGVSAARNLGVRESNSEYIAFLDADDEWLPWHLDTMDGLLKRFPDVEVCGGNCIAGELNGKLSVPFVDKIIKFDIFSLFPDIIPVNSSTMIIKRGAFEEVGGFTVGRTFFEDGELLFKLGLRGRFVVSGKVTAKYHSDAVARATHNNPGIEKYGHLHFIESELVAGRKDKRFIKIGKRMFLLEMIRNYRHKQVNKNRILQDAYPTLFKEMGLFNSFFLNEKTALGCVISFWYKWVIDIQRWLRIKLLWQGMKWGMV